MQIVSTKADLYIMAGEHEAFEEGTVNYLNLPAISVGLQLLQETGIDTIHERVMALTSYLLKVCSRLAHSNGQELVEIYGPTDANHRGGTIAFNLRDSTAPTSPSNRSRLKPIWPTSPFGRAVSAIPAQVSTA